MKYSQETLEGGVFRITLEGALDMDAALNVDDHFMLAAEKQKRLVVDISGVDFLASIGIRTLVVTARRIGENGGRMSIYGAQEGPEKVLRSTGVDSIVKLVDSERAAIEWVSR
jgi:anti-anti-sigma factor